MNKDIANNKKGLAGKILAHVDGEAAQIGPFLSNNSKNPDYTGRKMR